jgi:hypothetical protein
VIEQLTAGVPVQDGLGLAIICPAALAALPPEIPENVMFPATTNALTVSRETKRFTPKNFI